MKPYFIQKPNIVNQEIGSVTVVLQELDFENSKKWAKEKLDDSKVSEINSYFSELSNYRFNNLDIFNYEVPVSGLLHSYTMFKKLTLDFFSQNFKNTPIRSKLIYEELANAELEIGFDTKPVVVIVDGKPKFSTKWRLVLEHAKEIKETLESINSGNNILEVGSGEGNIPMAFALSYPEQFKKLNYSGFDFAYNRTFNAQTLFKYPINGIQFDNTFFYNGDAKVICHEENSFDVVYCSRVLEQIKYGKDKALAEMARVGKYVVLIEPIADFQNIYSKQHIKKQDYINLKISDIERYGEIIKVKKLNAYDPCYIDAIVVMKCS
jgi:ubiquinone/menaquinone biosynthesis C-methylase UbiE